MRAIDTATPVLLLGGRENSLSLVRNLGRAGIAVSASGDRFCWGMHSRYCHKAYPVPQGKSVTEFWTQLLLSGDRSLDGHIVFPCNDEAVELLAKRHAEFEARYILDDCTPEIAFASLDKMKTLELARAAGVPTPNFWQVRSVEDVEAIRDKVTFPIMVKPLSSHKFNAVFKRKLFIIEESFEELKEKARLALEHGLEIMVVEMIPGPDDLLNSYYTYIDRDGRYLFHFTKRIIRRYPINRGGACYHITEWLPETADLGRKLFTGINLRGLGNIEFKRDTRDGKLKVIEINPRFTAPHELIVRCGAPIDLIVYCHLTGQEIPRFETFGQFVRLWHPVKDFLAFLELNRRGELSFWQWLRSVAHRGQIFPIFSLSDPMPFFASAGSVFSKLKGRRLE
jgi:predicted ATP-grasp superfamily ATP-dependent carboligase